MSRKLERKPEPTLGGELKNYITPEGEKKLRAELHDLLTLKRPEVVKVVSWAAENGDRSENGDYIYGKRRLREIDRRIRFLTKRLESIEIVDPLKLASATSDGRVKFGNIVKVEDEDGNAKKYQIVGVDESNPSEGKISWISPLAKALIGSKVGDVVTLKTPKGEQDIEILSISLPD